MTIHDKATRLTARVAPYIQAIAEARAGGLTWKDIAALIGAGTPDAVRQAVRNCKYRAEQLPLPEPSQPPTRTSTAPPKPAGQSQPFDINSLPRIGGR